jgi:hypothetical protein
MERQSAGQLDAGSATVTQERNMMALTDPEGRLGNESRHGGIYPGGTDGGMRLGLGLELKGFGLGEKGFGNPGVGVDWVSTNGPGVGINGPSRP